MLRTFRDFLLLPPSFEADEERTRQARLLYRVLQVGWVIPLDIVLVSILVPDNAPLFLPIAAIFTGLNLVFMFLARRGLLHLTSLGFLSVLFTIATYTDVTVGGGVRPATVLIAAAILAGGLLLGSRGAIGMALALGLEHGIVVWLSTQNVLRPISPPPTPATNFVVVLISYTAIAVIFSIASNSLEAALARARQSEQALMKSNRELQELSQELERRVRERTQALERHILDLKTAGEVSRAAASMRNPQQLLPQVAHLISQRFGFYHVGIFLLDESGEYAVLRASNSPGGQRLLARGHRLKVGEVGIVGHVAGSGQARIALDVGADAVYFDNPDLPETRSEMALPLRSGGQVLGVLDVQSTQPQAFTEEDVAVLQIVADQLAISIENSRLLEESRQALEASQRAFGEAAARAWKSLLERVAPLGFRSGERGNVVQVDSNAWIPEAQRAAAEGTAVTSADGTTLYLPIVSRGQSIGILKLAKPGQSRWMEFEIQAAQMIADQLSGALESARLYEEAQRRAAKEQVISAISSKISASINLQNILQTAVEELGRAIPGSDVLIQFQSAAESAPAEERLS